MNWPLLVGIYVASWLLVGAVPNTTASDIVRIAGPVTCILLAPGVAAMFIGAVIGDGVHWVLEQTRRVSK